MAIPTLPRVKRRRGLGNEASDFVKAFLATQKAFADTALAEKRGRLYDAQIARYEEMNAASKERRERVGKGGGAKSMSDEDFQNYLRDKLNPKREPAAGDRPAVKPPVDAAPIDRRLAANEQPSEAIPTTVMAQNNIEDENKPQEAIQTADMSAPSYNTYDSYTLPNEPAFEPTQFAVEGGAIESSESEVPLEVALDAALRYVQSSYGLDRRGAVDDGASGQLEAFARNEGAIPEETMTELLATVDPNAKDQIGAVLQKVYGFHAGNGDRAGAAEAVGSIIQAARQESMDLGALALAAIEQRDFRAAGDALIDAYNKVPDGRYVEGRVDDRGVGEALIRDERSGKVVQRLPLNPQTLQMAAQRFQSGSDFYNHIAQFARASKQRTALAVGGGMMETIDEADEQDAKLVEDLPTDEPVAQTPIRGADLSPREESEADLPAEGATAMEGRRPEEISVGGVERIPYAPGMSATQRRQVDSINRSLESRYKEKLAADKAAATQRAQDERAARTADDLRARTDPEYRRERALRPIDVEEAQDKARLAEMQREANRASLSGEDVDVLGTRTKETASPVQPWRRGLTMESEAERKRLAPRDVERDYRRLNITAKNAREEDMADREEIEKKFDTYSNSAKQNARGQVDPASVIKVEPEVRDRLIDAAENITRYNRLSAGRAAEFAYDAVYAPPEKAPRVTRSDQGWRVTIGNRSVTMDADTFRTLAAQRADHMRSVANAQEAVVKREAQKARDEVAARVGRRQAIDDLDAKFSDTATARKRRTVIGIDPTR